MASQAFLVYYLAKGHLSYPYYLLSRLSRIYRAATPLTQPLTKITSYTLKRIVSNDL